jgi:uncharacterized protein YegP (UPF0339 family)
MYFEIFKNTTLNKYWWVIKSKGNHETLCHSEMLNSKQTCLEAIRKVATEASGSLYYDRTNET